MIVNGLDLVFKLGTTDFSGDINTLALEGEDADGGLVTVAKVRAGGANDWFLRGEAAQDLAAGSLHTFLSTSAGQTNIAYVFGPYGNAVPTADKPHWTGTVRIGRKPNVNFEADEESSFEFEIRCNEDPVKKTAV